MQERSVLVSASVCLLTFLSYGTLAAARQREHGVQLARKRRVAAVAGGHSLHVPGELSVLGGIALE